MINKVIVMISHINQTYYAPETSKQTGIDEPTREIKLHLLTELLKEADTDALLQLFSDLLPDYSDAALMTLNSITAAELKKRRLPISRGRSGQSSHTSSDESSLHIRRDHTDDPL